MKIGKFTCVSAVISVMISIITRIQSFLHTYIHSLIDSFIYSFFCLFVHFTTGSTVHVQRLLAEPPHHKVDALTKHIVLDFNQILTSCTFPFNCF